MTHEELQKLIDAVDWATHYVPGDVQRALRIVSNLLVDLPDATVEGLELRRPAEEVTAGCVKRKPSLLAS